MTTPLAITMNDMTAIGRDVAHRASGYTLAVETVFDDSVAAELWEDAAERSVFNHPAWFRAAIAAHGRRRPLRVIQVRQRGRTIALWPLWLKRLGAKEMFARVLEPVGARVTDYCFPLVRRGHGLTHVFDLLLQVARRELGPHRLLLWPKLPEPFVPAAETAIDADSGLVAAARERDCLLMSLPSDYGALEKRWSKSHRGDVRRQIKRLSVVGRLELVTATSRSEILDLLPRLIAMHTANWRARKGQAEFEDPGMRDFITALATGLPVDLIDATEVRVDGVPIASHFGFRDQGVIRWYKPAFAPQWRTYAPGKVHVALTARRAIAEQFTAFDFMQGEEAYKRQWADVRRPTKSYLLARPIARPLWAWNAAVRNFVAEYRT